jgi:hypothetical protein
VDYGAWSTYIHERLSGFEMRQPPADFNLADTIMAGSKDRMDFAEFYQSGEAGFARPGRRMLAVNVGPVKYTGHALSGGTSTI